MAISTSLLTSGSNTSELSSYSTASISPTGNNLILACVESIDNGAAEVPSVTGGGMTTWTEILSVNFSQLSGGYSNLSIFRSLESSPGSGTVDFGYADNQFGCIWNILEVSGIDTGGTNGSAAIVQSASGTKGDGGNSYLDVTLAAFADANNGTIAFFTAYQTTGGLTPDTGMTELGDVSRASFDNNVHTQWQTGNDTVVRSTITDSGTGEMSGIALEIKIAAVGGNAPTGNIHGCIHGPFGGVI